MHTVRGMSLARVEVVLVDKREIVVELWGVA